MSVAAPKRTRFAQAQATYLVVNQRREREIVKEIGKVLPHVRVSVLAETLVVEAVHLGDLSRLVVTTQDRHSVAVSHLERNEQGNRLDTVVATVDIVTHEEIVGVWRVASNAEELGKIMLSGPSTSQHAKSQVSACMSTYELTVNVTTDRYGATDWLDVGLFKQDLTSLFTRVIEGWRKKGQASVLACVVSK